MNRLISALVLTVFFVSVSACSSAKPPAPETVQGNKIIASLKDLNSFYNKKNLAGFMNLVADTFKERKEFADAVGAVFSKYETVQFTIQYTRMFIMIEDKGMARATFNWDSGWQTADGSMLKNSGRTTFAFDPRDAKLVLIEGKSPFIPQAIETQRQ